MTDGDAHNRVVLVIDDDASVRTTLAFFTTRAFSLAPMSTAVEYLFATNLHIADRAARKRGWRAHGRSGWIKPDGNEVHFLCFPEQVAAIPRDTMIYVVGNLPPQLERLSRKWTLIHT